MTDQLSTLLTIAQDGDAGFLGAGEGATPAGQSSGEGAGTAADGSGAAPTGPAPSTPNILPLLVMGMVFIVVMTFFSGRKEKKKRAELMSSLGKHDRVQTIGGVIGVITEIRDDEVVLRVDESSNTRIRFSRASIQQVLKSSGRKEDPVAKLEEDKEPETTTV